MTSPQPDTLSRPEPAGGPHYWDALDTPHQVRWAIAGAVTTGAGKATYTNNSNETLRVLGVSLKVGTAPTGADILVDVNVDGTSQFTAGTRPKIVAGQTTGVGFPVDDPDSQALVPPGGVVTLDVDQVGSTVAGAAPDFVVYLAEVATGGFHWKELRDGYVRPKVREAELLPLDVNPA